VQRPHPGRLVLTSLPSISLCSQRDGSSPHPR
jgi:hypothetical protein